MTSAESVARELLRALEDRDLQVGLSRSVATATASIRSTLSAYPHVVELAKEVRRKKDEVIENLEYYVDLAMKNVEKRGGHAYFAKTKAEAAKIVGDIVGQGKLVVKAKSMVTEEIGLREYLQERGNEVWETDLGELLIQISGDRPMHLLGPALHMSKERIARLLRQVGLEAREDMKHEELVALARRFLRDKFVRADVGISGANSMAADTAAIVLVENEGNIRHTTNLPPVHVAVVAIDKLMPTYADAINQVIVQSAYAGLYPPVYLSVISGPSATGDIEYHVVRGAHGPKELHVILYDGGRMQARKHPLLRESLRCIRCARCQVECPVWDVVAGVWGSGPYGGPTGLNWVAIVEGEEAAAPLAVFCLLCGRCKEVCPMEIDHPRVLRYLKSLFVRSRVLR